MALWVGSGELEVGGEEAADGAAGAKFLLGRGFHVPYQPVKRREDTQNVCL